MIPISKPVIKQEEIQAVVEVLKSGMLVQGSKVSALERELAKLCGTKYAIATNNGTTALHTALYSIGIKAGDEIITTPFTFIATVNSILMIGATPIFVDIDRKMFNIDPNKIEKAITKKTKAILVVNLYGQPADYNKINKIAKRHKLLVIGDAAQSISAVYKNKKSGNLADISCFSFYATKNIMCGEGGMITTNIEEYHKRAKRFRNQGQDEKVKYRYLDIGYNYRMTDISAAIVLEQLKRIDEITKKRQEIAERYNEAFKNIKGLIIPFTAKDRTHVYHQYTLRVTNDFKLTQDQFQKYLEDKGIQANIYYPRLLYYFNHLKKYKREDCRTAEQISQEVISIPVYPLLTNKEIKYIIDTISSI